MLIGYWDTIFNGIFMRYSWNINGIESTIWAISLKYNGI
jgi:hypothetical protein